MAISHFPASTSPDDSIFDFAFTTGQDDFKTAALQRSPHTTSSPDDAADDDDDFPSEDGTGIEKACQGPTSSQPKRGKASSAERRAAHNATERLRRGSLNDRFSELAGALPSLATVKRASKNVIVNKSLEYIYESKIREHALVTENNALRAEINEMRARLQMPPMAPPAPLPSAGGGRRGAGVDSAPLQPAPAQYNSQPTAVSLFATPAVTHPNLQSPAHFSGFAGLHAPSHISAFPDPLEALLAMGDGGRPAGSTPSTGSDASVDAISLHNTGRASILGGFASPQALSTSSEAGSDAPTSTPPLGGDHLAGLQAAYNQNQHYAALAAVGQPNAPWGMMC